GDPVTITVEVAGVVGDVRPTTFASEPEPELYLPYDRSPTGSITFVVRTRGDAAAMMPALRRQLWRIDPGQSIYHEATVEQLVAGTLVERRFYLVLIGTFSAIALVLATIGVFGVISFATSRRVNEIGVRIALGARPRDVALSVVGHGVRLGVPGVLLGAAAAFGLTRFLTGMLYGVRPTDPLTFVQTGALLLLIAALAAYLPARGAARVEPARALRQE
ncbi:MAG TPA: FtsX-like permease family protein, partial [Longimicrobiales bacterium]